MEDLSWQVLFAKSPHKVSPEVFERLYSVQELMINSAKQLRGARRNGGITQELLAKQMGTSQGAIARFERGRGADVGIGFLARYLIALKSLGISTKLTL